MKMVRKTKRKAWKLREHSLSKALIYFTDGNMRTFYSYDWLHEYSKIRDAKIGLDRLEKMIKNFGNQIDTAIIYNLSNDQVIKKYQKGAFIKCK